MKQNEQLILAIFSGNVFSPTKLFNIPNRSPSNEWLQKQINVVRQLCLTFGL